MTTITIGPQTFKAKTKREAREKADRLLASLLENDLPYLIEWRGTAALVFRTGTSWGYRIIAAPDCALKSGTVFHGACGGENTREYAIANAVEHVAQNGWRPEDGPAFPLASHVSYPRLDDVRSRHESWAGAQRRYIEERERGLSDGEEA